MSKAASIKNWHCNGRNADGSACQRSFETKLGRNIHRTVAGHHPRTDRVEAGDSYQPPRLRLQPATPKPR